MTLIGFNKITKEEVSVQSKFDIGDYGYKLGKNNQVEKFLITKVSLGIKYDEIKDEVVKDYESYEAKQGKSNYVGVTGLMTEREIWEELTCIIDKAEEVIKNK